MAIYSPTQLLPNATSVDPTATPTISWTYNGIGTEASQTDYQVVIYSLANSLVYDSTKTTSSNEYHVMSSTPLSAGQTYKYKVTTWSGASSADSAWTLLHANSVSSLTLSATPTNQQTFSFSCTYSQAEDIKLLTYVANLYLASDLTTPIDTSGTVYPTSLIGDGDTISYEFDGMITGTQYAIEFTGITQRGEEITSGQTTFTVTYTYPADIPLLEVEANNDEAYIQLDWSAIRQVLGTVSGTYSFESDGRFNKGLQLDAGSTYTLIKDINEDFTFTGWFNLASGFNGTICKFYNDDDGSFIRVFFNGTKFGFEMSNGFITVGKNASSAIGEWILIGYKYGKLIINSLSHNEIISGVG